MWRALFLGIGTFLIILGGEFLATERVLLKAREDPPKAIGFEEPKLGPNKTVMPPNWAPWTLLSTGAVTCIYSFTLPKKVAGK
jgi:hypothetical protein